MSKLLLACTILHIHVAESLRNFTFALVPKSNGPYFNASHDGCMDAATLLGVQCIWAAPTVSDPELQANITLDLIRSGKVDGLAISVSNTDIMTPIIAESIQAGIPVVTFDSDAPDSTRYVYIGTDNEFFGSELGKVLNNLQPNGGTFAIVAGTAPNLQTRSLALMNYLDGTGKWKQLPNSPSDCEEDFNISIQQMAGFSSQSPTAIVSVLGTPMHSGRWQKFAIEDARPRNITLVCADALADQIAFLDRGKISRALYLRNSASLKLGLLFSSRICRWLGGPASLRNGVSGCRGASKHKNWKHAFTRSYWNECAGSSQSAASAPQTCRQQQPHWKLNVRRVHPIWNY